MNVILSVKIVPKARQNKIIGWENGWLKIQIQAVPEKGEANKELLDFLAKTFQIPKRCLYITSGNTSRLKKICLEEISEEEIFAKVGNP
jgi:uncharacterized protein (TIGR00251 family)